ncbi:MAG: Abi family protein [Candidatus Humimicrobiaceae bacterium]
MTEATDKNIFIKPPTTYTEQIDLLKKRKLIVFDDAKACSILKDTNYYRLSGYMLSVKKDNEFFDNTTLEQIYTYHNFDKKLIQILFDLIEDIEIAFRSRIAYYIAHKYGPLSYKSSKNFSDKDMHSYFLAELNKKVKSAYKQELFIKHHFLKYDGEIPIWVLVEILSFSSLSKLFSNMKNEDKKEFSKTYYNSKYFYLQSWIHHLVYVRNICAHFSRLYYKLLVIKPKFLEKDLKLMRPTDKIFDTFFILKKFCCDKNRYGTLLNEIDDLFIHFPEVVKSHIGFPEDWKEILNK